MLLLELVLVLCSSVTNIQPRPNFYVKLNKHFILAGKFSFLFYDDNIYEPENCLKLILIMIDLSENI